jgi:hypothetical protein
MTLVYPFEYASLSRRPIAGKRIIFDIARRGANLHRGA